MWNVDHQYLIAKNFGLRCLLKNDLHLPFHVIPRGLLEFFLNVGKVKKNGLGHVCIICLVAVCKVKPLKSIFIYVMMGIKLENLLFANNHEFPTTTLVGTRRMEHQWLDLTLHLVHQMYVNKMMHLQLNVIFWVYIPPKNLFKK